MLLAGVVVAHLQLAQQADGQQLNAGEDEHAGNHKQRAVLVHYMLMRVEDLHAQQNGRENAAEENAQRAKAAEEVQRPREVLEQKADGEQIEEDAEGAADAVVALAALALHVLDRNLADGGAVPAGQRGNEAMHFTVERNVVDDFAAIGLVGSAEVVNVHVGELGHQPVGAARGNAAHHEVVDALLAPAGDDVVALFQLFDKVRNLVGVVLQVAVHGEDELARGVIEAGRKRGRLPKIAAQFDHQHAAVDRGNLFQQFVSAVAGAVIDKHQLKAVAHLLHYLLQARIKNGDVLLFIVKRNDD